MGEREYTMWRDIYGFSGLRGLIVNGCPSDVIDLIRNHDRANLGIKHEDDLAAQDAVEHPEVFKNALIIRLPHNYWRCATDYLLFSAKQFFIDMKDGSAVAHLFGEAEYSFKQHFGKKVDFVDDMYFLIPSDYKGEAFDQFRALV